MIINPKIFKDYDIRAVVPTELDTEGMYQLGLAMAIYFKPKAVAIGRDMRVSSPDFYAQLSRAFTEMGINVIYLGEVTTDMSYFAAATLDVDLALMITASHNEKEYNGLKVTIRGAIPVSGETGLYAIRDLLQKPLSLVKGTESGVITEMNIWEAWVKHSLSLVKANEIKPLKVVVDAGNGMGGVITSAIAKHIPLQVTPLFFEPDGTFPHHLPNPLLPANIVDLKNKVKEIKADFGIAWDGDADRVYLIDEEGTFVDGTAFGAMLADYMLASHPGDTVIYNAIIGRVVPEIIQKYGGVPVRWRVGHALLKAKMREVNGLLAVEHSGHFFFRDNFYCDSGIISLLTVLVILSNANMPVSQFLEQYRKYTPSGEINFAVGDKDAVMKALAAAHEGTAESIDWLDGVTVWYPDWWFNVRPSNTQPLLRLNIEVNNSNIKMSDKESELVDFITQHGGNRVEA